MITQEYLQYKNTQLFMQEIQRVKTITLKDNKNRQQKYMLMANILGKGKYGKVYKAIHVDNPDKIFAVKVIALQSQKVRDQCLKQLQIIKHLPKSLNLVQIHSQHLQSNNNFYLFEEFCNGGDLYQQKIRRKDKPYTQEEVYNLFFQIVNGFIDLTKANIFHEDIKPQNILIKNNIYKLTDFGISQLADKIQVSQIRRGTLVYMPPQKLKATNYMPTAKSQIFSLGVTLYQIIFGHHPYLKKKPANYKQYLKMLQEAQLKPLEQLKTNFPSHSLCIDRLIRTIFRMIQLNQTKRISLEELQSYIKNTEPFKSMVVSQVQPIAKRKTQKTVKYQQVGHSHVIVRSQNGIGQLLAGKNENKKKQKMKFAVQIYKVCLQLFRDASSFIQQGIMYAKDSNINQLKKIQYDSDVGLNKIKKITQIQFLTKLFIQKMFNQFQRLIQNLRFENDLQKGWDSFSSNLEQDKQFIANQFLKVYMDIQLQDKKLIWTQLKEKGNQLGIIIIKKIQQIFSNISCIRINYKQDMLIVLFLKFVPNIIKFIKNILDFMITNTNTGTNTNTDNNQQIKKLINSKEYDEIKLILINFSAIQIQKKQKVYKYFCQNMKGHQLLEDDQSNSDQFQILDFD